MHFRPNSNVKRLVILGAGASVDYGLPVWDELQDLILEHMKRDTVNRYKHKEAISEWVEKVGSGKDHPTIDVCISIESRAKKYHSTGLDIENDIFQVMRDIFEEKYRAPENGWLERLNVKILTKPNLDGKIAFVNYNYDRVLEDNFLDFSFLPQKDRLSIRRGRLSQLSDVIVNALYPHGSLYRELETNSAHIFRVQETHKTNSGEYIDAVSCHESHSHTFSTHDITAAIQLYIIGLGAGLEVNLNNLTIRNPISEIYVTVHNPERIGSVVNFLSKRYAMATEKIHVYETAVDLVENCFNDQ
ncbi:hypothetical protein KW782_01335 [Candidatus Parcubacteria bacterium]|nr:hypothetical protein [Candidatus Parcubacteria bacterium]